jgi:hypothetical protein
MNLLPSFTSEWFRTRVVFGVGAIDRLAAELDALGLARALLIVTRGRANDLTWLRSRLGNRIVDVCDGAALHVPIERVRAAIELADRASPQALLAVGGGSAIGLAKAIALERPWPIVAVPTTYAGSEMTSVWGITEGATKRTGRNAAVAPRVVVYDPALTLPLPADVSAASGMNAIAHCGGGDVRGGGQPDRAGGRRRCLAIAVTRASRRGRAAGLDRRADPRAPRSARGGRGAGTGGHGPAPQDLPRARRHLRPAARADPCGDAAAGGGLSIHPRRPWP